MTLPAIDVHPAHDAGPAPTDLDEFIYLISHDVRNSVRALIELPQWIEEDLLASGVPLQGPVRDSIDLMHRHTGRLDRMLVDLLAYSRIGRMQDVVSVNLDDSVTDVLEQINAPTGFQIVRGLDCPTLVIGESDIMTLLTALLSNAVKHHDRTAGKVVVTTHRDRDTFILRVTDDGPGIPAEFHEKVFAAMTTLRPRDDVEGSGMGLALARKVAKHYCGTVAIAASGRDRGTTIEVRFPVGRQT